MSEVFEWERVRERANELFGQFPKPEVEQEIIDVFVEFPHQVIGMVEKIGARVAAGQVRSGWAILRMEALTAREDKPRRATASDVGEREKRIRQAEAWIRNSGVHVDREAELELELFDSRGLLRHWAGDPQLRRRMVELWTEGRARLARERAGDDSEVKSM